MQKRTHVALLLALAGPGLALAATADAIDQTSVCMREGPKLGGLQHAYPPRLPVTLNDLAPSSSRLYTKMGLGPIARLEQRQAAFQKYREEMRASLKLSYECMAFQLANNTQIVGQAVMQTPPQNQYDAWKFVMGQHLESKLYAAVMMQLEQAINLLKKEGLAPAERDKLLWSADVSSASLSALTELLDLSGPVSLAYAQVLDANSINPECRQPTPAEKAAMLAMPGGEMAVKARLAKLGTPACKSGVQRYADPIQYQDWLLAQTITPASGPSFKIGMYARPDSDRLMGAEEYVNAGPFLSQATTATATAKPAVIPVDKIPGLTEWERDLLDAKRKLETVEDCKRRSVELDRAVKARETTNAAQADERQVIKGCLSTGGDRADEAVSAIFWGLAKNPEPKRPWLSGLFGGTDTSDPEKARKDQQDDAISDARKGAFCYNELRESERTNNPPTSGRLGSELLACYKRGVNKIIAYIRKAAPAEPAPDPVAQVAETPPTRLEACRRELADLHNAYFVRHEITIDRMEDKQKMLADCIANETQAGAK